jgi:hypothetical protein
MAISAAQLNFVADSLRLVTDAAGVVQPGNTVNAEVVSSLSDLNAVDSVGPTSIPLARPVDIEVTWHVYDESGIERGPGVDFVSTGGLGGISAGFVFKPPIVELTYGGLATHTWEIRVRVSVSAEGVTSPVTRDLSVPVELLELGIPKFVALFRHRNFEAIDDNLEGGFVLLMVPYHSVLQGIVGPFNELMKQIDLALRPLRTLAGIASFLTGIEVLSHALNAQPMMRLRRGSVDDLEGIHMRVETFLGVDLFNRDLRANDGASALAVMGPCGTRIGFYDDEDFDLDNGEFAFNIVTGPEMVTIVRDLHDGKPPPTFPEEDPNNPLTRRLWVIQEGGEPVFADNITSVRFDNTVFAPDEEEVTSKLCGAEVSTPRG